jgi:hypothetical protein
VNQAVPVAEMLVQLEVELTDEAGSTTVEARTVSADQVDEAQRIIAGAARAGLLINQFNCNGGSVAID